MKICYYLFIATLVLASCKTSTTEEQTTENTEEVQEIEKIVAVCITNGVPIRKEPNKEAKYLSSLNLGETFLYLGETAIDTNDKNREYYKVELSDGNVAWARSYGIKIDATPAAIISETPIYKRPDLVTKTNKLYKPIEFIAVISEKEEWVEVVGSGNKRSGWILKRNITTSKEDVATATLANKDLLKNGDIVMDKIPDFLEQLPYPNSQFAALLQNMLDDQVEDAVMQSIENYEEAEEEIYN